MNREAFANTLKRFENKWVALADDQIIASGDTVAEVKEKAEKTAHKEYSFYLVPSSSVSLAPHLHGAEV